MFHDMRRRDLGLPESEAWEILAKATWGVLSTLGPDGWPYGVPLNHVVVGKQLYAHCAQAGHKLENLAFEPRVSYCVVTEDEVLPAELVTWYESAILFGRAALVEAPAEKRAALEALLMRFAADFPEQGAESMKKDFARTAVIRITPEQVTGKARR